MKASNILPANFLIQGLLISALFEPFGALCSVASAEVTQVNANTRLVAIEHLHTQVYEHAHLPA